MPQLDRGLIKQRAARLREVGAVALTRHLNKWVGREADALIEREGFARLPDFTSVLMTQNNVAPASTIRLRFHAHDGAHLIGNPV
jgi:threonylcarbamoyladenosine tRNA methylthiotransferase MtaB